MAVTTVNNSDVFIFFGISGGITLAYSLFVLFNLKPAQTSDRVKFSGADGPHRAHGPHGAHGK